MTPALLTLVVDPPVTACVVITDGVIAYPPGEMPYAMLCDLDVVPSDARRVRMDAAVSNSFAFGGLSAVLAVTRVDGSSSAWPPCGAASSQR